MLAEQKKLLAQVQAAEQAAAGLYERGVKLAGVVQKLRDAAGELEARVRFIEKHSKPSPAPPAPPTPPAADPPAKRKGA